MPIIKKIKKSPRKTIVAKNQKNKGFEKAWEFWKTAHVDLSNFKFNREEANAIFG
jgi:hypothetical protein